MLLSGFLLLSCTGEAAKIQTDVFKEELPAQWITDSRPLPESDSLFYLDLPAPLFRKEFSASSPVESASLYITSAGYYQASLNGQTIGKNVLDPAWTDYGKRIYYTEYDLTTRIREGENCLGVTLGNGFYNPLPMRMWGRRNLREVLSIGKPAFIAKVRIRYEDGSKEEWVSDSSWSYAYGPLTRNSVYLGVTYDARFEMEDWDFAGFDDATWSAAVPAQDPGGRLQEAFFPPVQVTREILPTMISSPSEGIYLVDMGENFTGTYRIRLKGNKGDTIVFRLGERIYPDGSLNPMTAVTGQIKREGQGGPGAPDIAWQSDQYIMGEKEEQWFSPPFTYHTYRYLEIAGLEQAPEISDIRGLFIHSNVSAPNSFSSSNELLNQIQEATLRTFMANMVSVQSDCAAREKFGYGGDLNSTMESFLYNFQMRDFYLKTLYDWVDAMKDSSFVDTAPFVGIEYCGMSWESAFIIAQYYLYLYYHDTAIIREFYDRNKQWMEKAKAIHPDAWVDKGLSDHESLEPVPVELTGNGHYLQCARIMQLFADLMEDDAALARYEELAAKLESRMRETFWEKPVEGPINRQTLFSTLLYHDIVPEEEVPSAVDSLLAALQSAPAGHITAGIFGTKYVLESLSRHASPDRVFDIVNSTEFPGWGHMIDQGATTIWETWKESDNTYSNCHPMFGSVTEWFYRWLAGIRPVPDFPGFEEFILAPSHPEDLDSVRCTYVSPFGGIISNWTRVDEGIYHYELVIPDGSRARIGLPSDPSKVLRLTRDQEGMDPESIKGFSSGSFILTAGQYTMEISYIP